MARFPKKLTLKLQERVANNSLRHLPLNEDLVDFSSNDYLGFARNEKLFRATSEILIEKQQVANGSGGSRLLRGNHALYHEVELNLCKYFEVEAALVFNSGYDANVGFFASVPQRNDLVFYDEYIHASVRDGIKMGHAKSYKFEHNDLEDLKRKVELAQAQRSEVDSELFVVTESVFSMDGDSPDLLELSDYCQVHGIRLIVDEAHALGVFGDGGRGLLHDLGLQWKPFARIITFGKAWGCHGAAILGSEELRTYLLNFARSLIYTTALPQHTVAAVLAANQMANSEEGVRKQQILKERIKFFQEKILEFNLKGHFIESDSAIHCCILKGNSKVKRVSEALRIQGIDVRPILSPTVPEGEERLRFCLHSFNKEKDISKIFEVLKEHIVKLRPSIQRG
ncbi:MAG: aminotransferase class I/II-fold pyridoxal phosphate-dependent enzyme [Flavobacteriaceae bacterium]